MDDLLKQLFVSKVRIKILSIFLKDLTSSYHVRALVRLTNEEINAVRRELIKLEEIGLLKSAKEGNKRTYRLNKTCSIIYELRTVFFKQSEVGKKIITSLKHIEDIDCVILTESYLKGRYENKTDVDFLFIGKMKIRSVSEAMNSLEKELEKDIRYSVITREDYEFARKKREPFLMNVLERDKILILGRPEDLL